MLLQINGKGMDSHLMWPSLWTVMFMHQPSTLLWPRPTAGPAHLYGRLFCYFVQQPPFALKSQASTYMKPEDRAGMS